MQMVSKKDLDSAELETMRTSRSPAMVMTANGEVLAKEETTVYVKELDLFGTVMLLEEHPQFFHSESSARIMGILITGPAVKNHTSPKMERELIAIFHTMCHSPWFISEFFLNFIFSPTSAAFSSQDSVFDVKRYAENPEPERSGSTSEELRETRCIDQQKPNTRIKMMDAMNQRKFGR